MRTSTCLGERATSGKTRCYLPEVLTLGVYVASSALLVVAGGQKLLDPAPLVRALKSMRLRIPPTVVRAGALAEVALGVAALTTGSRVVAAGIALSYAAFTGVVVLALARGGVLASCGCFGKRDVPPTRTHALVTAGFAAVALDGALRGTSAAGTDLALLLAAAAVAATAYAALAVLPLVQPR